MRQTCIDWPCSILLCATVLDKQSDFYTAIHFDFDERPFKQCCEMRLLLFRKSFLSLFLPKEQAELHCCYCYYYDVLFFVSFRILQDQHNDTLFKLLLVVFRNFIDVEIKKIIINDLNAVIWNIIGIFCAWNNEKPIYCNN